MSNAWNHDWKSLIAQRLKDLNYRGLRDFAVDRPTSTFNELANELGGDRLAPVQIQDGLREECEANGALNEYFRDSLVRYLRKHVPNGIHNHGKWPLILAISSWAGSMGPALQAKCGRIARAIKRLPAEYSNWLPVSAQDEMLDEIFQKEGL